MKLFLVLFILVISLQGCNKLVDGDDNDIFDPVVKMTELENTQSFKLYKTPDLTASVTGPWSASLSWTAQGGNAVKYEIRQSRSIITSDNFLSCTLISNPPSPQTAGSVESCQISGLWQGTTYYFALISSDVFGNTSALSNIAGITTNYDSNLGAALFVITGTLKNTSQQAAGAGYSIFVKNMRSNVTSQAITGSDGSFSIQFVQTAEYYPVYSNDTLIFSVSINSDAVPVILSGSSSSEKIVSSAEISAKSTAVSLIFQ